MGLILDVFSEYMVTFTESTLQNEHMECLPAENLWSVAAEADILKSLFLTSVREEHDK